MTEGGGAGSKRAKPGDATDSALLNNNKFASLVDEDGNPVKKARKEKFPPIFTTSKDLGGGRIQALQRGDQNLLLQTGGFQTSGPTSPTEVLRTLHP